MIKKFHQLFEDVGAIDKPDIDPHDIRGEIEQIFKIAKDEGLDHMKGL